MASESEYSYPVIENTPVDDTAPKSLPPEKVFVVAVIIILITGSLIYGINKMVTAPSDYGKFDLNSKKSSTQNEQVAGTSIVGPYGKPNELPSPTPIVPSPTPTQAPAQTTSDPTATPTPTKKPDPSSTPIPNTPTPTDLPTPTASPSATITPTGTE